MKRSQINDIMRSADQFIRDCGFNLPPFAYWSPGEWQQKGPEASEIVSNTLGWDITDFGRGDFNSYGLFLFTLRNGPPGNQRRSGEKPYAEKLMIVENGQMTPMHFHWSKMEDIIVRGGGNLKIQLYNSTEDEGIDRENDVTISMDGVRLVLPPGSTVTLRPGESITLPPYCYHQFWGSDGRVLVGEVSMVNDDHADNRFHEKLGRFPTIEEDELPLYLLIMDYERYYGGF